MYTITKIGCWPVFKQDPKPIFYRRYLDGTFVFFKEEHHAPLFLNHLYIHQNIKFTIEREKQTVSYPF